MEPIIEELANEFDNRVKIGKINVDQNRKIQSTFNISGVPTFILFKQGKILKRQIGAHSKQQLINMIKDVASIEMLNR
jgi:thioredoxin 1